MRIGFLSEALPYLPCREGFRIYGANIIRTLRRNHEIDLITLLHRGDEARLDWAGTHCASVSTVQIEDHGVASRMGNVLSSGVRGLPTHYRKEIVSRLAAIGGRRRWEVLHVEGGFAGGLVPPGYPLPRVLSVHDSETLRWRELRRCARHWTQKVHASVMAWHASRYEGLVYPRFDRCVVVAPAEREALARIAPRARVDVIGNGTDTEYFKRSRSGRASIPSLVFHGNLGYGPNTGAAHELAEEILPLVRREIPEAVLHLVGAEPAPEVWELGRRPHVKLSADVPDVRPALEAARVYVCPIRHGGGIKNKVLEALAMQLPVVAYPEAIAGTECIRGVHVEVATTPAECAARIVDLLKDPLRREALSVEGRLLVEQRYSWESRAASYIRLYEAVIEQRTRLASYVAP